MGYREILMPYTRVYLPRQLAVLFKDIHESEQALRGIYERRQRGEDVPIRIARGSRATRPGALEGNERVYEGRLGQVSPHFTINEPDTVREVRRLLATANVPLTAERDQRATRVHIEVIRSLIQHLEARPEDAGRWSNEAVLGLIDVHENEYNGEGIVYVRAFERAPDDERTRGRLSGPEIELIRGASPNLPALVLLYWETPEDPILWYPTLVLSRDMPTYVFLSCLGNMSGRAVSSTFLRWASIERPIASPSFTGTAFPIKRPKCFKTRSRPPRRTNR